MKFKLLIVDLGKINPRDDLMNYRKNNYSFLEELNLRVEEMEESFLRGSSIEPLIVNNVGWELMDGYTRFMILKKHKQKKIYAYVGF